jgi:polysaccharide export outer membrane protein
MLIAVMIAACASPTGPSPVIPADDEDATEAEYRIGPGDTLDVFVWRHPDLSTAVPVRPDGNISTPLVEDMQAAGKTPTELARDIEVVLAEYIRSPQVNIIVTTFVGTFGEQIRVVGQAANPQALSYREGMTLLDVMIEVGGLGEFAAGNRAKVVRRTSDGQFEIKVRLDDLINRGEIGQNIDMRPGDVLIIPEARF